LLVNRFLKKVSSFTSLSVDWSGGGIVTTLDDLSLFAEALMNHKLLEPDTLKEMQQFDQKFMTGIYYGMGFMEYRFKEYFPTLKSLPEMRGHMGILGTQMMYDSSSQTTLIINFASLEAIGLSVRTAIQILSIIKRIS